MMRQSEFKKKFDPDKGKFSRKHIYGEGIMDSVESFFGKKKVKFAVPPPPNQNLSVVQIKMLVIK